MHPLMQETQKRMHLKMGLIKHGNSVSIWMVLNLNHGRRHYSTHRRKKGQFPPLINVAQNKFRENRKRNKNDRTDTKKQKIDPVHQLLIDGLPPPKPIATQTIQTANKPESVKHMPTSSTILPSSPSLSVQPTQKPLRSEPNTSQTIQKKDNSNDAVLNQNERPKEPIKSPSKKPALKDMMKMFDFNCSDSDSE